MRRKGFSTIFGPDASQRRPQVTHGRATLSGAARRSAPQFGQRAGIKATSFDGFVTEAA
jgi:hypothetical protein